MEEIRIEQLREITNEIYPLAESHYNELKDSLKKNGIDYPEFNPNVENCIQGNETGHIIVYTARVDGELVGYLFVQLFYNVFNYDFNAQELSFYVKKNHRNGIGKRLAFFCLNDLRNRKVKFLQVTASVDMRVTKLWQRIGFKPVSHSLLYQF